MEQATADLVTGFISTVGFPIFVAVYQMVKGSRDSKELKEAINELRVALVKIQKGE